MLVDAMDMIREHIRDPEMRAEFGAEGLDSDLPWPCWMPVKAQA